MKGYLWLMGAMLAVTTLAHAGSAVPRWKADADAMLAEIPGDGPGASVAVAVGGQVIYTTARGQASVPLHVPLVSGSQFRIGSLTKTVTAASILRLQDEGRLSVDDVLARWLPTFPNAAHIHLRQLLSHTAGISDAWEAPLADPLTTDAQVALIARAKPDFAPGTDWRYSNSGYMLLGAVLEKVTGEPWHEAERALVLAPLGLKRMAYRDDAAVVDGLAEGYTTGADGQLRRPVLYSMAGPGAAGALTSDAADVAMLMHGLARNEGSALFKAMSTSATLGSTPVGYGFGTMPGAIRGVPVVEHSGGIEGYSSYYVYVPSLDLSVAVLENTDAPGVSPRSLAHRLAALAMHKPYRVLKSSPWPAERLRSLACTYRIPGGGRHTVSMRGQVAWIRRDDGPEKPLVTSADDTLYYKGDGIDFIRVSRGRNGSIDALEFHEEGGEAFRREPRASP